MISPLEGLRVTPTGNSSGSHTVSVPAAHRKLGLVQMLAWHRGRILVEQSLQWLETFSHLDQAAADRDVL